MNLLLKNGVMSLSKNTADSARSVTFEKIPDNMLSDMDKVNFYLLLN